MLSVFYISRIWSAGYYRRVIVNMYESKAQQSTAKHSKAQQSIRSLTEYCETIIFSVKLRIKWGVLTISH
jgi:NADH:ubiquinone oxidoreductase subunit 2 (subunit N)